MSEWVLFLRWLHVIGATVLLGTGAGIAFFMVMAQRSGRAELVAHVAATVVVADFIFTASAVVIQPLTGALLALAIGWKFTELWVMASLGLYVLTGLFWLPVVCIQMRIRKLAETAAAAGHPLPAEEVRLFRLWMAMGVPAFLSVLAIIWLMLARPTFA